jgi:predicted phosphoribosyltransferase
VSHRPFRDRRDVGRVLAGLLGESRGRSDVIPRGGVPVAYEVATALGAPLDVFVVRKLGMPGREELAMGAIASGGVTVINDDVARGLTKRSGTSFARLARDWFTRHLHAGRPRPEAPEEGNSRS